MQNRAINPPSQPTEANRNAAIEQELDVKFIKKLNGSSDKKTVITSLTPPSAQSSSLQSTVTGDPKKLDDNRRAGSACVPQSGFDR